MVVAVPDTADTHTHAIDIILTEVASNVASYNNQKVISYFLE